MLMKAHTAWIFGVALAPVWAAVSILSSLAQENTSPLKVSVKVVPSAKMAGVEKEALEKPNPWVVKKLSPVPKIDGDLSDWTGAGFYRISSGEHLVGQVAMAHDGKNLYLAWEVVDSSPLMNRGQDPMCHFKEGDCVDLMLGPYRAQAGGPVKGDLRLLFVPLPEGPAVFLYRQVWPGAEKDFNYRFESPVRYVDFDFAAQIQEVEVVFKKTDGGYLCEARVPFQALAIQPGPGAKMRGDMGILSSNDGGMMTERRCYLFNQKAHVTADLPTEAELLPAEWGVLEFK